MALLREAYFVPVFTCGGDRPRCLLCAGLMPMTSPTSAASWFTRAGDWIFRISAMRAARARLVASTETRQRALDQAKILVEVARRVAEPVEALPRGHRPAVLVALYRDAIYWVLAADHSGDDNPPDLVTLWGGASPERLLKAAGTAAALATVRSALVDHSMSGALAISEQDVALVRAFVEFLLWDLDAPDRAIDRVHVQRWTRTLFVAAGVLVVAFGVRTLVRGPNLASAKVFKTSTALPECTAPNKCGDILLHTQNQDNPWADFDLGAVKPVRQVEVTNRSDCCGERIIPLIIEISIDDKVWTQVARRDTEFAVWAANFPKQRARYVRLRVPRTTVLNLDDVVIR
jgi:F5/8 type C domain